MPQQTTFKVQSLPRILCPKSKVSELVIEELKCWNEDLIHSIFEKEKAINICSIPLSKMGFEDKIIWGYTNVGKFTARSSYNAKHMRRRSRKGEPSNVNAQNKKWRKVWKLNVPGVVKQFFMESFKWDSS